MDKYKEKYRRLIETLPHAYARHRIVTDESGYPTDYIFLEVNTAFEKMTGLKSGNIIGQKVTEVLSGIEKNDFDWIAIYSKITQDGNIVSFEQFSEPLKRWYDVQAYIDEPGYFTTVFSEITAIKLESASMQEQLKLNENLLGADSAELDYQQIVATLQLLSGAKFVAINSYEENRTKTITQAIAGMPDLINKASKAMGIKITGHDWEILPERLHEIKGGKLVRFRTLNETAMGALNKKVATMIQKLAGIGDIFVIELAYSGQETVGDIIFFMPKNKDIKNSESIELCASQLGSLLVKLRAEQNLKDNQKKLAQAQVFARTGLWEYDINRGTLYWSKECEALFGLEEGEFEGNFESFMKRVHPEDKHYVINMNKPIRENKEFIPLEYEHRILKKDGSVLWVKESAGVIKDDNGKPSFVTGFTTDISDRKHAEILLQESETKFRELVENMSEVIYALDEKASITYVSPSVESVTGFKPTELINKSFTNIIHPDDLEGRIENYSKVMSGSTQVSEYRIVNKNGHTVWIRTSSRPVVRDGKTIGVQGVLTDITERKEAEAEIKSARDQYQSLVDNIPGITYRCKFDHDWTMLYMSDAVDPLTGYPASDFIHNAKRTYASVIYPDDTDYVAQRVNDAVAAGLPWDIEYRVCHRDKEIRWAREKGRPVLDENGAVTFLDGFILDVTGQKSAQQKLMESEEKFRQITESMGEVFWLRNTDNTEMIYISPAYEKVWGRSCQSLYDNPQAFIDAVYDEDKPALLAEFENYMNTGRFDFEYRIVRPDGDIRWIQAQSFPVVNASGEVIRHTGIAVDITARKQAEEALTERLAFEKMVSGISANFINLPLEELDKGINEALKSVGLHFKVDRSYIYRFSEDGRFYSNTHVWCSSGINAYYEKDQNVPVVAESCWEGELLKGNLVIINDVEAMPSELEVDKRDFQLEEIQSLLTIPLTREGKVFGCFGLDSVVKKQVWPEEQIILLQVVAELIAGALIRHTSEQKIRRLSFNDQLTGLYNRRYFENELNRLDNSREHPISVISGDLDGLKLVNDTIGHAEGDRYLKAGAELLQQNLRASDILARVGGDEFALLLPRTDKIEAELLMNRIRRQVEAYNLEQNNLPLSISLGMAASEGPEYPLEQTFRTADNNMYNIKLQQGKNARAEIVSALLSSLFERGNLTEGDRDLVQELVIRLGQAIGLEEERMANLALLAQVYDLGKVGLPDCLLHSNLLKNTGELSEAERDAIHRHPETGYRIATASPELAGVAEMVLKHHENYDGSGYPLGLKSEEIPIENRILSIAIAYSAMTNPRPYSETRTHEGALAELKRCAGSQFDPQLVEIFVELLEGEIS